MCGVGSVLGFPFPIALTSPQSQHPVGKFGENGQSSGAGSKPSLDQTVGITVGQPSGKSLETGSPSGDLCFPDKDCLMYSPAAVKGILKP